MATRPAGEDPNIRGTNFTRQELETLTRRFTEIAPILPHTTATVASALSTIAAASATGASPTSAQSVASQSAAAAVPSGAGVGGGGAVDGGGGGTGAGGVLGGTGAGVIVGPGVGLEGYGKIDRARFRDLLADCFGVDDSLLMDRVFRCFDLDADNYISYEEFIRGMSVFLKGRIEEQIRFCFRVYDLNGDRYISKEEMFQMLKNCLFKGSEEDEDGVKDLVDLVLKKLDEDRDGRVSEGDWTGAIGKEGLLLEAFGQCLPGRVAVESYLSPTNPTPTSQSSTPNRKTRLPALAATSSHTIRSSPPSGTSTPPILPSKLEPHHHKAHVSKHVHPHKQQGGSRRVVVAPAGGVGGR
ncbi:EF-hand calcium-binding domain-containing protein 1 [Rhizophlyctis rosea]|nr:EF-hand calcium-binding domain-containing protein 1 [Rhizophlyctis rosea]